MNKSAIIFIGIQSSGKTTYYNNNLSNYIHISLDELHTRNKEKILIEECLREGKSFVVDNTNPTKLDRERYIPIAKNNSYKVVGYFFESKLKSCIERNNKREGKAKIPVKAIIATSNRLELPKLSEGFDELYFIGFDENGKQVRKEWIE